MRPLTRDSKGDSSGVKRAAVPLCESLGLYQLEAPTIPLMTQSQQNPEIQKGILVLFLHVIRHVFQILAATFLVKTCLVEVESADFFFSPPPLTQQVSECPYCSRMAAATQTYECVLVWKYCRQPLAIKLGRSRALYFTCLFGAVTPTSAFQDLATIYLFLPIEGNIQDFSFFHGGELTVNRPAFVSSASTDRAWLCFSLTDAFQRRSAVGFLSVYI